MAKPVKQFITFFGIKNMYRAVSLGLDFHAWDYFYESYDTLEEAKLGLNEHLDERHWAQVVDLGKGELVAYYDDGWGDLDCE